MKFLLISQCFTNFQTLSSSFSPKSTLSLLEKNYQTYCAQNDLLIEDTFSMKEKVAKVLEQTGLGGERAAKCGEGEFLKLLQAFREENIFFC
jgi:18S rRNA (adenine1779-N6/adenine1780-N6)-dimethyltransferase